MRLPVSARYFTWLVPTSAASRWVPDHPGQVAMLASGKPKFAESTAMRISATAASSSPPPSAWPLIAAMTGTRNCAHRSKTWWPRLTQRRHMSSGSRAGHALMSAPTENGLSPAPVRITHRICASESRRWAICASSSIMSGVRALSLPARSRTTVATAPPVSSRTAPEVDSDMGTLLQGKSHRGITEQRGIHDFQLRIDFQRKRGLCENVALKIDTGCDFPHDEAIRAQFHDASLGNIGHGLSALARHPATEGDVLNLLHELAALAFLQNLQLSVSDIQSCPGGEEAGKDNLPCMRSDIDEAAASGGQVRFGAQFGNIDVAIPIDLKKGQQRDVESAPLEIGELAGRGDDRIRVRGAAECKPQQRNAAHGALFDDPGDFAMQPFFQQHTRHVGGNAKAEIDGGTAGKLLCCASRDDFLWPPFGQFEALIRPGYLAADGRIVCRLGGLHLLGIHDHMVDQRSRHVNLLRFERLRANHALDLRDDDPAVIARGERLVEGAKECAFVFIGQIPALVRRRRSYDRDAWRYCRKKQPFLCLKSDLFDYRLPRGELVHCSTMACRIDERIEPDLGEHAGTLGGGIAVHVEQNAAGQIVGGDFLVDDQTPDLRHRQRGRAARIGAGQDFLEHARMGEMVDA